MAHVKIILDKDETPEEAEEFLYKALKSQRNGDLHGDDFGDPAMADALKFMIELHRKEHEALMEEIDKILASEVD